MGNRNREVKNDQKWNVLLFYINIKQEL